MGVRFSAVWLAVGLALGSCGGTSNKPKPTLGAQPNCGADECPVACEASSRFCFERQLWRCSSDGKSARVLESCAADEVCKEDGSTAQCECEGDDCDPPPMPSCTPDARECRDGDVYECDADGTEVVLYDDCDEAQLEVCDATTLVCVSACPGDPACPELVCKPGDRLCVGDAVHICQPDGLALVLSQACAPSNCVDDAPEKGFAYCKPRDCVPGSDVCHDNQIKVCADDGTLPAEGTDCGDDFCQAGVCKPKICEPFANFCFEGDVHVCDNYGIAGQELKPCPDTAPCAEITPDQFDCRGRPCLPGASACLGNAVGVCATDGQSLSQVTTNCAALNQVCNTSANCIATAVDGAGLAEEVEPLGSSTFLGNIIDVSSNRLLTELAVNLLLEAPRDLRFVVYEKKEQSFEVICSEITANNVGSAFFSTTALSCALEAGKRYAVGVVLLVGEGYHYYDAEPYNGGLSFGTALGSTSNGYSVTMFFDLYPTHLYRQRLTTELP
jgi:hypothetical protein